MPHNTPSEKPGYTPFAGFSCDVGAYSSRGSRGRNEDSFFIEPGLLCVSDGIGGAPHGDVMSKVCCGAFCEAIREPASEGLRLGDWLLDRVLKADSLVTKVGNYLGGGPGATLVAAVALGEKVAFISVGDSAVFVYADGKLSSVFESVGREPGKANTLSAAMGYGMLCSKPEEVRIKILDSVPGETILACTDGVWSQLSLSQIASELSSAREAYRNAKNIVELAVESCANGSDNATAAVMVLEDAKAPNSNTPVSTALE